MEQLKFGSAISSSDYRILCNNSATWLSPTIYSAKCEEYLRNILLHGSTLVEVCLLNLFPQTAQMKEKDKRIKLLAEVFNGIKVLKLYAWEGSFTGLINEIRQKELSLLKKAGYINAISIFVWQCAPFFVSILCDLYIIEIFLLANHVRVKQG